MWEEGLRTTADCDDRGIMGSFARGKPRLGLADPRVGYDANHAIQFRKNSFAFSVPDKGVPSDIDVCVDNAESPQIATLLRNILNETGIVLHVFENYGSQPIDWVRKRVAGWKDSDLQDLLDCARQSRLAGRAFADRVPSTTPPLPPPSPPTVAPPPAAALPILPAHASGTGRGGSAASPTPIPTLTDARLLQ